MDEAAKAQHVKVWGVSIDPTVNVGHLMTAGVFLATAMAGWAQLDSRQTRLEERAARLERLQEQDQRETAVMQALIARQAAQLDGIQAGLRRIETLLDRPPHTAPGVPR